MEARRFPGSAAIDQLATTLVAGGNKIVPLVVINHLNRC